ncbi:MAG TPA: mechanosensitive ion channel [Steroidobacteraceae bacterium]|nr:mechanosensitive ion channel [Steroidobacteraceae bacterium]
MNEQVATISHAKDTMLDLAIRFGPRVLTAVLILVAGFIVGKWVSGGFARMLERRELEPPIRALFTRIVWAMCVLLFAIMALQNLGVELLPLVAGLGVAGAGVALAMQGVLGNVVAGLSIILSKPFKVGEYIAIAGVEGAVESIRLFSTTLMHADRSLVVIPNRKIVGEILHNYGRIRQLDVTVGVAYDTDLAAALATLREVLAANPRVLRDPPPVVQPLKLGESAVALAVRPWVQVQDQGAASGEVCAAVLAAFRARGVIMPPPQREVRILGGQPQP